MKQQTKRFAVIVAASLALAGSALAQGNLITSFDNFASDALYPGWALPSATVVSGLTEYTITATGYGSNYKYIGGSSINGVGSTHLQLTVNLSGPAGADGHLGPIIGLIDGDGTHVNYAWYGQTLGSHVLTMGLDTPTWTAVPGSTPGLDLATLTHMHMQLDPGGFGSSGAYTIAWQDLQMVTVPEPSAVALIGLGVAGMIFVRRRRIAAN